jgi:hypothetical protein
MSGMPRSAGNCSRRKDPAILWLAAAFVIGFFAVGIPYWQVPYSKVSLPSTLYGFGVVAVAILAAAARLLSNARLRTVILVIGAAVPAAVLVRVVVETTNDPTSHNLWPFELVIAAVVGLVCSSAGAIAGSLISVFSRR